jgi:hypothetical protein
LRSIFTLSASRVVASSVAVFIACPLASFAAETLDVKPGEWEFSQTMTASGAPIYVEAMTPAQRAAYAKSWEKEAGKPNSSVEKQCITAKDVKDSMLFKDQAQEGKQCKQNVGRSTKTAWSAIVDCKDGKSSTHTQADYNAPSPQKLSGAVKSSTTSPNGVTVIEFKFTGRWIGAMCSAQDSAESSEPEAQSEGK